MEMLHKILELWGFLSKRRHRQFWILIGIMLVASIAEIFSLGAVLPFLGAITSPEMVYQHAYMQPFVKLLNIKSADQIILPVSCIFIGFALFAGAIRILLVYILTRFSFATGADLSVTIYRRTLFKPYEEHIDCNSSEVINGIMTKTNTVIGGIIIPTLNGMSSLVLLVSIMFTLLVINPTITLITFGIFFCLYVTIFLSMRRNLHKNGEHIAKQTTVMLRSLQEGLGGIRDVLVDGTQEYYCNLYKSADYQFRRASGTNVIITSSPRFAMEAVGMALIASLAYWMFKEDNSTTIPLLGALALGAQRMLPVLQNLYSSYGTITGGDASFQDVLDLLNTPSPAYADQPPGDLVPFNKSITLDEVSFRYKSNSLYVFKDINLTINKGSCVGFIGQTGCGKSTMLDVIMGLLSISEGKLRVDGESITKKNVREWQGHISHVPQTIYLADLTIMENIALGIAKGNIDEERVVRAAKKAKIHDTISKLDSKYETMVGEGGARLSGGQRQRIGIARALYKETSVLIFDEATSALDNQTELNVMDEIRQLGDGITVLIIAHRLSSLKGCDHVYEVSGGRLLEKQSI
jgi:ABC-type multidrug transport system fused ATPase/permease subunit